MEERPLITLTDPHSPVSEAYKVLRTNIQYTSVDRPLRVICVTSATPMEGKTTTLSNLAVTFAQMGSRVLLVDTDLRKPKINSLFWQFSRPGLTNYLASHGDIHDYIFATEVENLSVLPSGAIPPNPAELLSSETMKQLILHISSEYDIVLMDAPPLGSVIDASIISTYVDGILLVARSGKVEIDALKRAKEQLMKVNANIIGVVLNRMDRKATGNQYYQSYYSDEKSDTKKRKGRKPKKQKETASTTVE